MKKLILLIIITLSFCSCYNTSGHTIITTEQYIANLNSFDSTARYYADDINNSEVTFIISYKDSLFIYYVERSGVSDAIFVNKDSGDKVK